MEEEAKEIAAQIEALIESQQNLVIGPPSGLNSNGRTTVEGVNAEVVGFIDSCNAIAWKENDSYKALVPVTDSTIRSRIYKKRRSRSRPEPRSFDLVIIYSISE